MSGLGVDALAKDSRLKKGKRLLLEALAEHQRSITGIRPPDPERAAEFGERMAAMERLRGQPPYLPYLGSGLGRGPYVELADGSVKLDFICGIGVHYLGHGYPGIVEAALDAALADLVMEGNLQQNRDALALGERLLGVANRSGAELEHLLLTTSGAMANENALKIAFQKRAPANRVLTFEGGFCGRTLALASVTDRPAYREGLPDTLQVDYVPFFDPKDPQGSTERTLAVLQRHLDRYPGQHAAMLFELVLGEGGFYPGNAAFFESLTAELHAREVAVAVDEIQTFGRTPEPFAFQYFGLDQRVDIVTVGKMTQVCATLYRDAYQPRAGLVSQTFTGGTAAIRAAHVVLDTLLGGGFFGPSGRIARLGEYFVHGLEAIARRRAGAVQGPYGLGAMVAFTPFDGSPEVAKLVVRKLFEAGVIAFTAGSRPTRVRFLVPAGAATEADVDIACRVLDEVLGNMFGEQGVTDS